MVLACTWIFKLPAVPRLYLPVLGLGLLGSTSVIDALLDKRWVVRAFVLVLLANYGIALWGTFGFLLGA